MRKNLNKSGGREWEAVKNPQHMPQLPYMTAIAKEEGQVESGGKSGNE
jgi:hypothetical protein